MTRSTAEVSADAIQANVATLADHVGDADICAVVKADGYGHGAVGAARAALAGGARWLAVAHVDEAAALRAVGIDAPVLLLSEPDADAAVIDRVLGLGLHVTVYRPDFVDALAARVAALGTAPVPVHVKVDTGMGRVGCDPGAVVDLAERISADVGLRMAGTMTHLAVADEPASPTTGVQLDRFDAVLAALRTAGIDPGIVHAANSAAAIAHPRSRYDLVRVGIAIYGIPPDPGLAGAVELRPALRWTSSVALVKPVRAGWSVSYGHHYTYPADTVVATVPVGYADGYRRDLGLRGGEVLVGGVRAPVVGVVTMDQFMVDVGAVDGVGVGDEVVLIGRQGDEEIAAIDVAARLDTIGYEIVCAIGARVGRTWR